MSDQLKKKIRDICETLSGENLLGKIRFVPSFNDDPKVFLYLTHIKNSGRYSDGYSFIPEGLGVSISSPEKALLKSLSESLERLCQSSHQNSVGTRASYNELLRKGKQGIDPCWYISDFSLQDASFLWVEGEDFVTRKSVFIPKQLVYLTYLKSDEPVLVVEQNTNGTAGGFSRDFAVTRAIYEAVERDAFFSFYLNKITPIRLDMFSLGIKEATWVLNECIKYNLELMLFDITHDLGIPTFMALLLDRTGLSPALAVGLKSHLNPREAIRGSLEEIFMSRTTLRRRFVKHTKGNSSLAYDQINTFDLRGLFWSLPNKLMEIDFLLRAKLERKIYPDKEIPDSEQISRLRMIFKRAGFKVFVASISMDIFVPIGYVAIKVIIPDLQPFYLAETAKSLNEDRLKQMASFFGKKTSEFNSVPHFLL